MRRNVFFALSIGWALTACCPIGPRSFSISYTPFQENPLDIVRPEDAEWIIDISEGFSMKLSSAVFLPGARRSYSKRAYGAILLPIGVREDAARSKLLAESGPIWQIAQRTIKNGKVSAWYVFTTRSSEYICIGAYCARPSFRRW